MTEREAILQALFARLQTISDAKVLRNEALPEKIPDGGLIIFRDGDPGEPETLLSPVSYYWQHRALVEAVVQKGDQAARDLALDSLYRKISI
ncbi:MAG: acyl-CoA transferase, partial [Alphaproteobacteria bacterium]